MREYDLGWVEQGTGNTCRLREEELLEVCPLAEMMNRSDDRRDEMWQDLYTITIIITIIII